MAYGMRSRNKHQLIKDPLNRLYLQCGSGRRWLAVPVLLSEY